MENHFDNNGLGLGGAAVDRADGGDNLGYDSDGSASEQSSDAGSECDQAFDLDEGALEGIRHNEPPLTHIDIDYANSNGFVNNVDWKEIGPSIEKNTHLKTITIRGFDSSEENEQRDTSFRNLLNGVARCPSIKYFQFYGCVFRDAGSSLGIMSLFFQKVHKFGVVNCCVDNNSAISLAKVLRESSALDRICFDIGSRNPNAYNLERLLAALEGHRNIKEIDLGGSTMGWEAVHQLGKLIQNLHSKLEEIDLCDCSLNVASIDYLSTYLVKKRSLNTLSLANNYDITSPGWQVFFEILRNDKVVLEELDISDNNINDESLEYLAGALSNNTTLNILNIGTC